MSIRRRRQYFNANRRAAIARSYARRWREADTADLPVFIATVNQHFAGRPFVDWPVAVNERRRTVTLGALQGDYRVTLWPDALKRVGRRYGAITADDVATFQRRPV